MRSATVSMTDLARPCVVCGGGEGPEVFGSCLDICGLGEVAFAIRCCADCGMVQQDPAVTPETLARQYSLFSNYTQFGGGEPPLWPSTARMLALAGRLPPGRVYEIGAATGAALWHFRKAGWQVGGCDPSVRAVEQAKAFNGVDLDVGGEETALPGRRDVDLIAMSHVLEHLADPLASLARMRASLAPSGMLLVEVPCLAEPQINPPGLFTLEHLNYFSEASLAHLLARAGFVVAEAVATSDHWPFPVITVLAGRADVAEVPGRAGFEDSIAFLDAYLARDAALWAGVDQRIRQQIAPGSPVAIWGAGVHTSMVLARTGLADHARIAAITDRDTQKHGHRLGAHAVIAPQAALSLGGKVVVSSYFSEAEIAASLVGSGVAPERIVRLHGAAPP